MSVCSGYSLRTLSIGICGLCVQGCVADFVSPLSVVVHRYPSIGQAAEPGRPTARRQVIEDYTTPKSDRLPTPREIFDFHPKGLAADQTRRPFLVDPNEGPLKIPRIAAADAAADQDQPTMTIPAKPSMGSAPRSMVAVPKSSFGHQ